MKKKTPRKSNRNFKAKLKALANGIKQKHGCCLCDINLPELLEFHHINAKDKTASVALLITNTRSEAVVMAEIEKCIIVCGNCHKIVHHWERTGELLNPRSCIVFEQKALNIFSNLEGY